MADANTVGGIVAVAGCISLYTTIKNGHSNQVIKVIFANVALFGAIAVIGQIFSWEFATGLAALYLLNSFLFDGTDFINWFSKLVS